MVTRQDNPTTQTVLDLVRAKGVLRPADLRTLPSARTVLQHLERQGRLVKLGRGLYALADASLTESASLAAVCLRVPDAGICLLSALSLVGGHSAPAE